MPSKTKKQAKLMRAVAHGWKPSRMKGPPVSVAKEFMRADMAKKKKRKRMQLGGLAQAVAPRGNPIGADAAGRPGVPPSLRGYLQTLRSQRKQGNPGGRIGTGDQQGALARAMQTQTGRPPISRRAPFPGRAR